MEQQQFLRNAYPELAEVLEQRLSETPEPQPIDTTVWLAMSLLQKSIRRGETGYALRAAATLLQESPDRLWKRLVVAAYEDVGLGDLATIAPVLTGTSAKAIRKAFGGDWTVASALVERMSQARKCRAADDLLMISISHPRYEGDRIGLSYRTQRELMQIVCGDDDLVTRAIALTYAVVTCP